MRKSLFLVTGFAALACCSTVFAQEESTPANVETTAEPADSETNQAPQQVTSAPKDFEFAIAKGAQPASKTDVENTEKKSSVPDRCSAGRSQAAQGRKRGPRK